VVVMNPDRLLATAKAHALKLVAAKAAPPAPFTYPLPGPTGAAALGLALHDFALKGLATPHDGVVGTALAQVLTGADTDITAPPLTEDQLLTLERQQLVALAKTPGTRARIAHLLATGKPLRN
jgi:3-hydroxyacyl-CoA dehydrogenase